MRHRKTRDEEEETAKNPILKDHHPFDIQGEGAECLAQAGHNKPS